MPLEKQSAKIQKEIKEIQENNSGRVARVFKMRDKVSGSKQNGQEAHALIDSRNGEMVVAREEIKRLSLEYNLDNMKKNDPVEEVKDIVEMKEKLHHLRVKEVHSRFSVT